MLKLSYYYRGRVRFVGGPSISRQRAHTHERDGDFLTNCMMNMISSGISLTHRGKHTGGKVDKDYALPPRHSRYHLRTRTLTRQRGGERRHGTLHAADAT